MISLSAKRFAKQPESSSHTYFKKYDYICSLRVVECLVLLLPGYESENYQF